MIYLIFPFFTDDWKPRCYEDDASKKVPFDIIELYGCRKLEIWASNLNALFLQGKSSLCLKQVSRIWKVSNSCQRNL